MKKPLLALIISCTTLPAICQITRIDTVKPETHTSKTPRSETEIQNSFTFTAGVTALGIDQYPKILNQTNSSDMVTSSFHGILFKYNDNQISYRFSGSLTNQSVTFTNECEDCETTSGKLQDYQIRTGFEKSLLYTRIQPFFGADLGYRNNKFKGSSAAAGTNYSVTPYDVVAEKKGPTLTPLAGIRFNLINHLTVSTEAGFDLFYSYERQQKTFRDANRTRTVQTFTKFEFLPRPLAGLSLQYNFGLND